MAQRIKGQEVTLSFVDSGGGDEAVGDVNSFEAELDIETLEEQYLGETSKRYDDIYNGVSGNCELHLETQRWVSFTQLIERRAKRRDAAGGKFTATATFNFPNGTVSQIVFEDIFFGAVPIRVSSRSDYVTVTLNWKCSNIARL